MSPDANQSSMPLSASFQGLLESLDHYEWLAPLYAVDLWGIPLMHYAVVLALVFGVWLLARSVTFLVKTYVKYVAKKTQTQLDDAIFQTIQRSLSFLLVLGALYFGLRSLALPANINVVFEKLIFILFTLKVARELEHFAGFAVEAYLKPMARKQKGMVKVILPPILRFSRIVIWILAILLIVSNLGYNVSSLMAGLGIGGIALALGAQEALSNVFGSLSIMMDQTFRPGDFIAADGFEGTVLDIGLRSTRIRTNDQTIVSIPNKRIASVDVENYENCKRWLIRQTLDFTYNTSLVELKAIIKDLEKMLKKHPKVSKDVVRVHFAGFAESSLQVQLYYYIDEPDYAASFPIRQEINLKIKERVEKMGIDMAFPTRSLYIENAKDLRTATKR